MLDVGKVDALRERLIGDSRYSDKSRVCIFLLSVCYGTTIIEQTEYIFVSCL